jgi:ribosomal protein S5
MATVNGLLLLRMPEDVAKARGKELSELDLPRSYFN